MEFKGPMVNTTVTIPMANLEKELNSMGLPTVARTKFLELKIKAEGE